MKCKANWQSQLLPCKPLPEDNFLCVCSYMCARSLGSIPQWMDCKIAGLMLCFPTHVPPCTNYLKIIIVLLENLCRYAMLQHKKRREELALLKSRDPQNVVLFFSYVPLCSSCWIEDQLKCNAFTIKTQTNPYVLPPNTLK